MEDTDTTTSVDVDVKQLKCSGCGGEVSFSPGETHVRCTYCGAQTDIPQSEADIHELDFHEYLGAAAAAADTIEEAVVRCDSCGAEVTLATDFASDACPFCGSDMIADGGTHKQIRPRSLLPFHVKREQAQTAFTSWINGLWFAPGSLKKLAVQTGRLSGLYVPYWTYDCSTTTYYRGERGEHYWVTEHYTTRENGKTVRKTRRKRKTRWYPARGVVWNSFDDVLVLASTSLPKSLAEKLEPWDLPNLVPYQDEYLSGFQAESYHVDLEQGFGEAKDTMESPIRHSVKRDIGGDVQRIHSMDTQHDNVTFKHILLPVWLSAYRFKDQVYRFLVNARTGEVQGQRPWSVAKILLAVLGALGLIGAIVITVGLLQR